LQWVGGPAVASQDGPARRSGGADSWGCAGARAV